MSQHRLWASAHYSRFLTRAHVKYGYDQGCDIRYMYIGQLDVIYKLRDGGNAKNGCQHLLKTMRNKEASTAFFGYPRFQRWSKMFGFAIIVRAQQRDGDRQLSR